MPTYDRHPEFDPAGDDLDVVRDHPLYCMMLCCLASGVRHANRQDQPFLLMLAYQYCSTNYRAIGLRQKRCGLKIRSKLSGSQLEQYPVFVHKVGSSSRYCIRLLALLYWFLSRLLLRTPTSRPKGSPTYPQTRPPTNPPMRLPTSPPTRPTRGKRKCQTYTVPFVFECLSGPASRHLFRNAQ
jgi:hypothetical protein